MDLAGNLYVAAIAKPKGEPFPQSFGRPADRPPTPFYPWMYGSVLKFPPTGGSIYYPAQGQQESARNEARRWPPAGADQMLQLSAFRCPEVYVRGSLWYRPGFTVTAPLGNCHCYTSRFAVDRFGRVFIPDVGQFSVLVVDANNNPILRFGDYGNEDCTGAGSAVPEPKIPLAWPYAVSVGKSGVYVSDFINRRVLRIDLRSEAEGICPIPPVAGS
jgi:hypothetical protein